jgi:hypothetical protein
VRRVVVTRNFPFPLAAGPEVWRLVVRVHPLGGLMMDEYLLAYLVLPGDTNLCGTLRLLAEVIIFYNSVLGS